MQYRFDQCEFDTEQFELLRDGNVIETTPQALAILQLLLISRSRLVTKDELVEEIWGGRAISDAAITVRMRALREAIGDNGKDQRLIKTVRGKGFRFVGEVTTRSPIAARNVSVEAPSEPLPSTDVDSRASIAVLPFLFSGDRTDMAFLRYAIPDEVLTELCKARWLMVIARGSSFQLESHQTRPSEILERLNARYCVSGTIEATDGGLVISIELADTKSESVIWRERQRIDLQEVHDLRSELVQSICLQLEHNIEQREYNAAQLAPASSLDSWQNFHVGMHHLNTSPVGHNHQAEACFERSLELDATMARARAGLSQVHFFSLHWGNSDQPDALARACQQEAIEALREDPLDPFCNLAMGRAGVLNRNYDIWRAHIEIAAQLSPSYAIALADLARIQSVTGEIAEAKSTLDLVERLDPISPHPETMELTRLILDMEAFNLEAAAARATDMAARGGLGLNTFGCVLVTLHLAGHSDLARNVAAKMKSQFHSDRLADWFTRSVFKSPEWSDATRSAATAYSFV